MTELENQVNETASKLDELLREGETVEKMQGERKNNGESLYNCEKCKTINAFYLSKFFMGCGNCGEHYYSDTPNPSHSFFNLDEDF